MVAVRDATGRLLSVFQNWRFRPELQKVLAIAGAGELGRLVQVRLVSHGFGRRWDWQTLRRFGGGSLNNTGAHLIDAALTLFGPGEPRVLYVSDCVQTLGDAEDHLKVVLTPDPADGDAARRRPSTSRSPPPAPTSSRCSTSWARKAGWWAATAS